MSNRMFGIIGFIVVLGLLALLFFFGQKEQKRLSDEIAELKNKISALEKILAPIKEAPPAQTSAYDIPLDQSYVLGDKDAKVQIVVFSNFQCPYCARADKALRDLLADNELKGEINLVFKHFPFERHTEARPAAKIALAAGEQGKFWEMSEKIFTHQNEMNTENYKKWAKELKLDMAKLETDLKDKDQKYNELIDRDIKVGAEQAKLEGTPWILVGGWLLEGEINPASIKKMIAEKKLNNTEVQK